MFASELFTSLCVEATSRRFRSLVCAELRTHFGKSGSLPRVGAVTLVVMAMSMSGKTQGNVQGTAGAAASGRWT
jgi:hypothetical protein